ncbi:serine hydrolase [Roseateles sp.]|uniref:serine hydrolase domain-containing protein n=1 Tax=Roseateles sp. TaxID=1971397 RepID=UPI0025DB4622|nr:serine hydrolase domain-containing protein [Roseateles sp.]MBV8035061.1 beta-lactamase family protein [Roseateles sp.]
MRPFLRCLPGLMAAAALGACQWGQPAPPPSAAFADAVPAQEQRFAAAFQEVDAWVARKAFPGAVLAVGVGGRLVALKSFGRLDASPDAPSMPVDAVFDVASLTKVVATTTAVALLCDDGLLRLDEPVVRYLPGFAGPPGHADITLRHLLSHSAGLPSPRLLWKHARTRDELLEAVERLPVEAPPGARYVYRDENFILLGQVVERVSGQPLDRFLAARVFEPLGMRDTGFNPPASLLPRIPATELDTHYRHRLVRGTVHDENADLMGGVAGHAGLFSTAADLSRLAQLYLGRGRLDDRPLLRPETVEGFIVRQDLPPGSSRALGWDTPQGQTGSFAGPLASPDAVMHTGFTGTSLYIDRSRQAFVVLLSNRVNPTRENRQIGAARIAIHTAVLAALDGHAPR